MVYISDLPIPILPLPLPILLRHLHSPNIRTLLHSIPNLNRTILNLLLTILNQGHNIPTFLLSTLNLQFTNNMNSLHLITVLYRWKISEAYF